MRDERVDRLIEVLQLRPHPEGGFFREIHRSSGTVHPDDGRPARSALTAIYYLLPSGQTSRWHRVQSDEVWHLYEGGPIELTVAPPDASRVEVATLGPVAADRWPVSTVPAGWWQTARPLGRYALCGCTVGPGFDFDDFTMLDDVPDLALRLRRLGGEA